MSKKTVLYTNEVIPTDSTTPGGCATADELFELLTLVQTGKLQRRPIVLVGREYWQGLHEWLLERVLVGACITESDMDYLQVVDDAAAAILLDPTQRRQ